MGNKTHDGRSGTESSIWRTWWLSASSPAPWRLRRIGKRFFGDNPELAFFEGALSMAYETIPLG